jgi:ankyrin repeat protein
MNQIIDPTKNTFKYNSMKTSIKPFYEAVLRNDLEYMKSWIKTNTGKNIIQFDDEGWTPLHYAVKLLDKDTFIQIMEVFIENGADINQCGSKDMSTFHNDINLLHYAVYYKVDIHIIEFLINNGANINYTNCIGSTPLHTVVENVDLKMVVYLVEKGANINISNNNGVTPLHIALRKFFVNINMVKFLIKNGANINSQDLTRWSPLHYAAINQSDDKIVRFLIKKGANINLIDSVNYWTPIMYCLAENRRKNLPILLAAGADHTNLDITFSNDNVLIKFRKNIITIPKKNIELVGFNAIRKRAMKICIAMQDLNLPAPQMIEIIKQSCVPFTENLPYHYLWDLVVTVKHFHDRQSKKM